jgi:hypothetical protein
VVALTLLQPLLLMFAGDLHFEAVDPVGLLLLVVALVRLARGSRVAWAVLIALNALPLLAALFLIAGTRPISFSFTSDLIILTATSAPLVAVLLSRPMRRYLARPAAPLAR